ncbi:hypothetical protein NMY22_g14632 [Coprinellus aureogranulatus]|nr:hypothetical protein NMY22_g14632 [Coprinellus aureogranulatus]
MNDLPSVERVELSLNVASSSPHILQAVAANYACHRHSSPPSQDLVPGSCADGLYGSPKLSSPDFVSASLSPASHTTTGHRPTDDNFQTTGKSPPRRAVYGGSRLGSELIRYGIGCKDRRFCKCPRTQMTAAHRYLTMKVSALLAPSFFAVVRPILRVPSLIDVTSTYRRARILHLLRLLFRA